MKSLPVMVRHKTAPVVIAGILSLGSATLFHFLSFSAQYQHSPWLIAFALALLVIPGSTLGLAWDHARGKRSFWGPATGTVILFWWVLILDLARFSAIVFMPLGIELVFLLWGAAGAILGGATGALIRALMRLGCGMARKAGKGDSRGRSVLGTPDQPS